MKNIYIAASHNGEPIAVILTDDLDKAIAVFTAMKTQYNTIEEINPNDPMLGESSGGVTFLLSSEERTIKHFEIRTGQEISFRKWKRGL